MSDDQQVIQEYARRVEDRLVGPAQQKASARAELVEHLTDAADAGELAEALARLGGPEAAAGSFAPARPEASFGRRLAAALIDNLPLLGVTVALLVQDLARGGQVLAAFPPFLYLQLAEGVCIGPPVGLDCGAYDDAGLLYSLGIPIALAWSILGLGILESRTGATPGKRLLGLWVATEAGLRISALAGVVRRTSFLVGPLAWLDWLPFLANRRRRVLDFVAGTKVVVVAEPGNHRRPPSDQDTARQRPERIEE
jgi:uncharacterized RDD family membrane protein YckC